MSHAAHAVASIWEWVHCAPPTTLTESPAPVGYLPAWANVRGKSSVHISNRNEAQSLFCMQHGVW